MNNKQQREADLQSRIAERIAELEAENEALEKQYSLLRSRSDRADNTKKRAELVDKIQTLKPFVR